MRVDLLASFELVFCAAIGALGVTMLAHVEENARVAAPQLHAGLFAGAEDAALGVQIFGGEFDGFAHGVGFQTLVSQCAYLGLRPFTMSKKAL